MNDLRTKMADEPEVQSKLQLAAEFGRDTAELKTFDFTTGEIDASDGDGAGESLREAGVAGVDRWRDGVEAAWLPGGCRWFDRGHAGPECARTQLRGGAGGGAEKSGILRAAQSEAEPAAADASKMLPPDPECKAGYLAVGVMKMHKVGYVNENVRLHDVDGGAQLHITPTELLFTALTGILPGGGEAEGVLRISNWLGEVEASCSDGFGDRRGCGEDGEQRGEERGRETDGEGPEFDSGEFGDGPSDGDGEGDSAADDHGCYGKAGLWRSRSGHGDNRAGHR